MPTPLEPTPEKHGMRLNRYLAHSGFGSRRSVEVLVNAGRVALNGEIITDLGRRVVPGDKVTVDGRPAEPPGSHKYVLLNKPAGYLCSKQDPWGRPLIYELLPDDFASLHYVGRLDFGSRGVLLLTDEGELTNRLLHPRYGREKHYRVRIDKSLSPEELEKLSQGVLIGPDEMARPSRISAEGAQLDVWLREGKKREIRRMLEAMGRRVVDLQRIEFAGIRLQGLPEGRYRLLEESEIHQLHAPTSSE